MHYMKTKFAIGCLVQWYEAEIIREYFNSLMHAIQEYSSIDIIVDILVCENQTLEKFTDRDSFEDCLSEIALAARQNSFKNIANYRRTADLVTIADYRREFNDKYCELVDVLVWGESDMLVPKNMFTALDNLHRNIQTPKYLATFGTCKMWDNSWKPLEHSEFTDKPFIENDYENWWSLKYTMTAKEMNQFNDDIEDLDVKIIAPHKFNGCGLVISSEVIKAGVNIPKSVFFVHEDSAFMQMTNKVLGNIPQYHFKNILLVHNRNHPKKRMHIKGERKDGTMNEKRRSNDWYTTANQMCEQNYLNMFDPTYKSFTWKDVWK
jgi:hypothetical protein